MLRGEAFAGEKPADPGFDGIENLRPYLERLSGAIRANAQKSPSKFGKTERPSNFFDAEPFPQPRDGQTILRRDLTDDDKTRQQLAYDTWKLIVSVCSLSDPSAPYLAWTRGALDRFLS